MQQVPTVAAVVAGRPVQLFVGLLAEEELRAVLDQVLQLAAQQGVTGTHPGRRRVTAEAPSPWTSRCRRTTRRRTTRSTAGDYAAAITEYETAIAQNPRDQLAVAGLAQVSLLRASTGRTRTRSARPRPPHPRTSTRSSPSPTSTSPAGTSTTPSTASSTCSRRLDADGKNAVRARLLELLRDRRRRRPARERGAPPPHGAAVLAVGTARPLQQPLGRMVTWCHTWHP